MTIMESMKASLPLEIRKASWASCSLAFEGSGWSLALYCPWRIVENGRITQSSGQDDDGVIAAKALIGSWIIEIGLQSKFAQFDLYIRIDDNRVIEIFSDQAIETWQLRLDSLDYTYVASAANVDYSLTS